MLRFLETAEPRAGAVTFEPHRSVPSVVPLFARLAADEAAAVAALGTERVVAAGETVVERWDTSREFFVVLAGTADVVVDSALVATLRAGEYFGEIAALEWGAGFARSRAATVVARDDVRLLVLGPDELAQLVEQFPRLEDELRLAANERLRRAR